MFRIPCLVLCLAGLTVAAELRVPFNLKALPTTPVRSLLVVGHAGHSGIYRLHNDGPDSVDVRLQDAKATEPSRHLVLGARQTADLAWQGEDVLVELPDGGRARGWYQKL